MLENIKKILGITDSSKDDILWILINQANVFCRNYTHNNCYIDHLVEKIVVATYRNDEVIKSIIETSSGETGGIKSEEYEGASITFQDSNSQMSAYGTISKLNIPDDVLLELKSLRKVRFF